MIYSCIWLRFLFCLICYIFSEMSSCSSPLSSIHSWEDALLHDDPRDNEMLAVFPQLEPVKAPRLPITQLQSRLLSIASRNYTYPNLCQFHSVFELTPLMYKHWSVINPSFCMSKFCIVCNSRP